MLVYQCGCRMLNVNHNPWWRKFARDAQINCAHRHKRRMLLMGIAQITERTVCCAAAAGSTMRATAVRLTATRTSPTSVTTTLAFALPSPESTGRDAVWMHRQPQQRWPKRRSRPASSPVCNGCKPLQQKEVGRRVLVGNEAAARPNARGSFT